MATTITFTYGATTLSIRAADFADTREVTRSQVRSRTHDGNLIVGDKELTITRFYLGWTDLTDTEQGEFETFFGSGVVNGSLNNFIYVDHFEVSYTVRLIDDAMSYRNNFTNLWSISIVLEVQEDASS